LAIISLVRESAVGAKLECPLGTALHPAILLARRYQENPATAHAANADAVQHAPISAPVEIAADSLAVVLIVMPD
jgi:hypothetical protein